MLANVSIVAKRVPLSQSPHKTTGVAMTGFVNRIMGKTSFCFITAENGVEYFGHKRDFLDPSVMKVGQRVEFRPKLAMLVGRCPPATDIIAIAQKAA
jgi:cold shock CspA family protein